jgi:hypothetical protein
MSKTIELIFFSILIIFVVIGEIMSARKRDKDRNKALAGKQCIREFECFIMIAYSDADIKLSFLSKYAPATYNVLLFEDHIAFTTGFVAGFGESIPDEIEIRDINFARMKNIFKTDFLLINYNRKAKESSNLYMEGKKEDLLYIKKFLEERMHRPQVIDLTGGDQTEQ